MTHRTLGNTGLYVSPLGFGAFKIGRNQGIKYAHGYELPTPEQVQELVENLLAMGVNFFDTAPAYGLSEERLGLALPADREKLVISTKVGEIFEDGQSRYDFTDQGVRQSIDRSRHRLRSDVLDLVFIHSNGDDLAILHETDVVATLHDLKSQGIVKYIGFSGKTVQGAQAALDWADALMVEYHLEDRSHAGAIAQAAAQGVGVVVKKGLASGRLPADQAIRFVMANPGVSSLIVGSLNEAHLRSNLAIAQSSLG